MSLAINKVFFSGRLTHDPKMGQTTDGYPVCNLTLAQDSRRYNRKTEKWEVGDPIFVDIAIWGARGEAFFKHHVKGNPAYIEGHLRFDAWEDRETGRKRSKLKVDADDWQFVPRPNGVDDTPF